MNAPATIIVDWDGYFFHLLPEPCKTQEAQSEEYDGGGFRNGFRCGLAVFPRVPVTVGEWVCPGRHNFLRGMRVLFTGRFSPEAGGCTEERPEGLTTSG
jgi:hypothetical protein